MYMQMYITSLKNGLSEKHEEYSKEALACNTLRENTVPLQQPSHRKAELAIGIARIINVLFKGYSMHIDV